MFAAKKVRNFIVDNRPCKRHKSHLFVRPRLEVLENRCLPTANIWDAVGTIGNWNNPGNWSLVHVPTASETVIFNSGPSCLIDAPAAGTNTCAGIAINGTYGEQIQDAADLIIGSDGLAQNSGVFLVAGSSTITDAGNWSEIGPGVFLPGMGTVDFNGGAGTTQQLDSGGSAFFNLTHSGPGTVVLINSPLAVNENFVNSAGTFDLNGQNISVTFGTVIEASTVQNSGASNTLSLTGGVDLMGGTLASATLSTGLGTSFWATPSSVPTFSRPILQPLREAWIWAMLIAFSRLRPAP
jgi:hypothetical protein